ncbi:MAG: hypothetical protein A2234_04800 [Elusimicrobia bacterium RIFOXYA2_FULL_58_8]|nr:MAG: hypothetical protein A2234_04800 [Elusimicrobia bacterium RIFOXYA2_FULL_58_8]
MKKLCAVIGLVVFVAVACGAGEGAASSQERGAAWDDVAAPPAKAPGARAVLRAMAKKGINIAATPQWAEFLKNSPAVAGKKTAKPAKGANEKLLRMELGQWRWSPEEKVSKGYIPCNAVNCKRLRVTGAGFYRAYFADGFVLRIDEAGRVLDMFYPEEYTRRLKMRARALELRPREMRSDPQWGAFAAELAAEAGKGAGNADTVQAEVAKWAGSPAEAPGAAWLQCAAAPDYCNALGITGKEYGKVSFEDGFVLVLDGARVVGCYYKAQETPAPVVKS